MERYVNYYFFFSSRRRHTRWPRDWSSDVCSSDLDSDEIRPGAHHTLDGVATTLRNNSDLRVRIEGDRKSTRLNSSHVAISYAVFCLKKKKKNCAIPSASKLWRMYNMKQLTPGMQS